MATEDGEIQQFNSCFENWILQQNEDLNQLILAFKEDSDDNEKLRSMIETSVKHYEDYHDKRHIYAQSNPSTFFSPNWCSSLENKYLWVAGCRPSLFLRLIHTISSSNLEMNLEEFLERVRTGNFEPLGHLSAEQLRLVDELQRKTIESEEDISSKVASMQEEIADKPLVEMTRSYGDQSTGSDHRVVGILGSLERAWLHMLDEADHLRLHMLKEIVKILTPLQAMEFLIAGKKLHLSLHQSCKLGRI